MRSIVCFISLFLLVLAAGKPLRSLRRGSAHPNNPHGVHHIAFTRSTTESGWPPALEVEALQGLYVSLDGPSWDTSEGWLEGNPCSWYGVECDVDGFVISIILLENNLAGEFPLSVANLSHLEILDISYNSISGPIERGVFTNLTSLRELYVNNNLFTGTLDFLEDLPDTMEVIYGPENMFEGTIPESIGRFTLVNNMQFFSNSLSGTLPESIGNMISLESVDFGFNMITGTLPESFGNLINLQYFWIYDSMLYGTLPASLGNLTNLILFESTRNQLVGTIPDSWANMQALETLRLGGNLFEGVPTCVCSMINLVDAVLYQNLFSAIPPCSNNSRLSLLLMHNNLLQGEIPEELGYLTGLKRIDLSHNQLSGPVPDSFSNLGELILLDFSHNNFSSSLESLLLPVARLDRLTSVDFSHNKISGTIPSSIVWSDATQEELSKSVTYLYLNNNELTGEIPDYLSWMFNMIFADLSYNNFSGPIPESLDFLGTLYVQGNPYMMGTDGNLPGFLAVDYTNMKKAENGAYACPYLKGASKEYTINVDPSYYNYSFCRCEQNFYGINGSCSDCPDHATCPGGGMTIIVDPGYFPYPDGFDPVYIAKCLTDNFGFTPCNPNSEYPFTCKSGYEGRLCSKCGDGYFARGNQCTQCLSRSNRIVVIAFILIAILIIYSFFLVTFPLISLPSAARKTGMFYFQALNMLLTRFTGWPSVFAFLSTISATFNFGFNFTCFFFDYYDIFYIMLALPLTSVFVNAIMLAAVWWTKNTTSWNVDIKRWGSGAIRTCILTLNFLYLPLCTTILSMFVCTEDEYDHESYLAVAPWIKCDSSPQFRTAVGVASVFFIIYVLGIPALFAYLLWKFNHRLQDDVVFVSLGSLYIDYRDKCHFYELAGLARRFLFALVIAVIRSDNLFLMSTILFVVLSGFAALQLRLRPFHYRLSNQLEIFAMVVLIFNLVSVLSSSSAFSSPSIGELLAMKIVVLLVNLLYILVLVVALFYGTTQLFLPEKWKKGMQASKSMMFLGKRERDREKSSSNLARSPSRSSVGVWGEGIRTSLSLRTFLGEDKKQKEREGVPTFLVAPSPPSLGTSTSTVTTSGE